MKKYQLLVVPLLVLPFAIACNNGGGQDVVVYHTLKFVSDTCYMKDDIGGQVSEKQFEAGETANFHLEPYEGYLLPLENQIDFKDTKTGEDFTGTHSYNPENGDISVRMTADVTIYAGNSVDPNYVIEQEFKDAVSFKNVQYLQVAETLKIYHSNRKLEFSPSVSHSFNQAESMYYDFYCRKNNDDPVTYDSCVKKESTADFQFSYNVDESYFIKPQSFVVGNLEKTLLDIIKETFGDDYFSQFKYLKGEYIAESSNGSVVLKFENKKVVRYEVRPNEAVYNWIIATLTYLEKTPEYPIKHNAIDIPDLGHTDDLTLYAQKGKMYIDITNATGCLKKDSVLYAAYCNLYDESSISLETPQVFSNVEASLGETPLAIFYGTESAVIPPSTVINAEYWQASLPDIIPDDTLYIVLTINNDYVSSQTGRTAKQNYTGDVSCTVHNIDDGDDTNTVKIEIDYDSITEQPAI